MRITAEKKAETRSRLIQIAGDLFGEQGFAETTTRHIAKKAHLASGTIFNYFRSKEELARALVVGLLEGAHVEFAATRRLAGTLDEWLFGLVATELRHLQSTRSYLREILNGVIHPFDSAGSVATEFRRVHLNQVREILDNFGIDGHAGIPGWEHLYWSLYLGVLAHWAADATSNQEATMALLDRAVGMFLSLVRFWPTAPRHYDIADDE